MREPILDELFHRYTLLDEMSAGFKQDNERAGPARDRAGPDARPQSYASAFAFTGTAKGADVTGVMYWGTILESWMTYSGYDTMPCS